MDENKNSGRTCALTLSGFVFRSIRYGFWMQLAVGFGVVIASAVLTGALLIGDSMRGSLRDLTLDRLGPIDDVLVCDHFVHEELTAAIEPQQGSRNAPLILVSAGTKFEEQTAGITLIGCSDSFWNLLHSANSKIPEPSHWARDEIVVNQALAEALGLSKAVGGKIDTTISLWVSRPERIPADSALGRREETLFRKRLRVREILPDRGIGAFSLRPNQKPEPLALVPLGWLQDRAQLDTPGKINMIAFANPEGTPNRRDVFRGGRATLPDIPFSLDDLGILVDSAPDGTVHVKTSKLLFSRPQSEAVARALPEAEEVLVYLAESLQCGGQETPYSLVAAVDELPIGEGEPLKIGDDEIVFNDWTTEDLGAKPGDAIELTYFTPESIDGRTETRKVVLRLTKTVPMQGLADDPLLVPELEGISDAKSLANWNPPFPFDAKKIRDKDEEYWDKYKTTPKAFVSLATGRKLWGSRFGETTTFVLKPKQESRPGEPAAPASSTTGPSATALSATAAIEKRLTAALVPQSALFGLTLEPVKQLGLAASAGTTPFNVLFLSFSCFIIAAALMLLGMLFRLEVERGASQIGTLLALGLTRGRIFAILAIEGTIVAFCGSVLGIPLGTAYARLMIFGLHHWWVDAIVVPFLSLYISAESVLIGFGSAMLLSFAVVFWTLRGLRVFSARELIAGEMSEKPGRTLGKRLSRFLLVVLGGTVLALVVAGFATSDQMVKAGLFFGTGSAVLVLSLLSVDSYLKHRSVNAGAKEKTASEFASVRTLWRFSLSNAARNSGRSVLCIGLLASCSFLVLAVGAFQLDSNDAQGSGGFALVGETQLPVYFDLNTESGREKLNIQPADAAFFNHNDVRLESVRVRPGDNAGCLNLYQPKNPRILGFGDSFLKRGGFRFSQVAASDKNLKNPWELLQGPIRKDADGALRVPIILDDNTAMYSLHLYQGVGEVFEMDDGRGTKIRCEVVALLSNSLLQGDVLMSETNLLQLFPDISGYRFFLVEQKPGTSLKETARILSETIGDFGLTLEPTQERLGRLFAVQNTYLSTFRSLGGFGLFLGTFGIGIVQLRNVLQRRKELALLRAFGFSRPRIAALLLNESVFLLGGGAVLGLLAAIIALFPQIGASTGLSGVALLRQCAGVCGGMIVIGLLSNILALRAVLCISPAQALANE